MEYTSRLYLFTIALSFLISALIALLGRKPLGKYLLDTPYGIKNHSNPVPLIGGIQIAIAFFITLTLIRYLTNFPTGTLHSLRGLFLGGGVIFISMLIDDIKKPKGLHYSLKFALQIAAALMLIFYDIKIKFIEPPLLANLITVLWVIGVTNAFNIIDILDGFSATIALIAAGVFIFIAFPYNFIYVALVCCALIGGILGFLPFNLSKQKKIFLGDSGSMFLGFILAAVSLGASYTGINKIAVLSPLFIFAVPLFDTLFVSLMRIKKGKSPFKGSDDHYAIRLRKKFNFTNTQTLVYSCLVGAIYSFFVIWASRINLKWALIIYAVILIDMGFAFLWFNKMEPDIHNE
ncbi:MAG: undecaprenyl/decaprenyl-phosphate alpha-N-acetylglucosaminyl 1-phosphate transferase [Elusimicrobiaceae bacterium]|jgi:UDP-GlcNAc:undecaprenyl-phosphate/decaprenyl-phosphate GlcNAc-1-phosphate transferase|nr:undecaprenyl/decaprenyl-phosphate alpha-N-acetylglucosaminyl 1-phosphate transferase [Elusimicrobiaceae bacterium]MBT3955078.1 undecaprenyl/decaprenyl-phosphate alpha-N-acetylglucosaminyl 1-phosphate transferase [Elusimicrobiaceae bacterium]MBT4007991.1 undecaprenyl/decaprenyl-phosphate alpha-N-acetylglucosaminyl 1-phosphate transferase [Elusimicrobiaceae bacterium]MBT4402900.1 undecaprenyl/decaprenyl-phosphate alpha-N-acetylglucosaminyl 1-phosphate transferase [Elusimicrobiaceae bacterium]M